MDDSRPLAIFNPTERARESASIGARSRTRSVGLRVAGYLILVAIDEVGNITPTGAQAEWDDAAPTRHEAALEHLAPAIADADAALERRRAKLPEPEPKPKPMDEATRRFYTDDDD